MNNEQFRRLAFDNISQKKTSPSQDASSPTSGAKAPSPGSQSRSQALGSRNRSSIPMTPRSVTGANFAQQLAEHRRESRQQPPSKKLKSSSAPKGSRLAQGYQDRTLLRRQAETETDGAVDNGGEGGGGEQAEEEDRAKRLEALEEMTKQGEIDQPTLEKLRKELGVGGDLGSTHLVKGLDFELLRRIRAGEDVSTTTATSGKPDDAGQAADEEQPTMNPDEEFDRALEATVEPVKRDSKPKKKKGTMAPPSALDQSSGTAEGGKMTRDEILARLKASRAKVGADPKQEAPESTLGAKFKKLGDTGSKKRWIETDDNGRRKEILLTTDRDGKTKRKVRWLDKPTDAPNTNNGLLPVDKNAKPLGMDVPADVLARMKAAKEQEEEEDDDIFQGVGADYNPLGDAEDDDSTSESEGQEGTKREEGELPQDDEKKKAESTAEEPSASGAFKPRNYFATDTTAPADEPKAGANPLASDPTIMAALKRAAAIRQGSTSGAAGDAEGQEDDEQRHKKFLEEARRRDMQDEMDMDMGFGGSRFGDDEDETVWQGQGATGNKRKRGPKKKKGDKERAGDVMRVLEGRQKAGDKT